MGLVSLLGFWSSTLQKFNLGFSSWVFTRTTHKNVIDISSPKVKIYMNSQNCLEIFCQLQKLQTAMELFADCLMDLDLATV